MPGVCNPAARGQLLRRASRARLYMLYISRPFRLFVTVYKFDRARARVPLPLNHAAAAIKTMQNMELSVYTVERAAVTKQPSVRE